MLLTLPGWRSYTNTAADLFKHRYKQFALAIPAALLFAFAAGLLSYDVSGVGAAGPISSKILDRDGNILYEIHGEVKRTPIEISKISQHLISATLVTEDESFYKHFGISPTAIGRATMANLKARSIQQGGSTITQQLVKNSLLTREKSFQRKIKEALLAVRLELKYSKEEILTMYLNSVPYGRNSYGAEAAALSYFAKSAKDLTLAESAYLASLPKAPSYLSPFGAHADQLEVRKNYVLDRMYELKYVKESEYLEAKQQKVSFYYAKTGISAPHFVEMIEDTLMQTYGRNFLETDGLVIRTSLDSKLQKIAEDVVRQEAERNKKTNKAYNAALVAMDPKTGEILALVGGKNYFGEAEPAGCNSGINCKFDPKVNTAIALRQPGSSFKPYTYVTAFSPQFGYSPASQILDQRTNFNRGGIEPYIPNNYSGKNYGKVSMRKALAGSLNVSAVRTLSMIGVNSVVKTAHDAGITSSLENCGLSLTLGACEVKLLDHVAGFATLANLGTASAPTAILSITNKKGEQIYYHTHQSKPALDPRATFLVVDIMRDNKARSFIFGAKSPLILADRPVAAKTGTSQDFRDGWTLGFTPSLVAGAWVGNNDSSPMRAGADGVFTAAPIWNKFMAEAVRGRPPENFPRPEGIQEVKISASSGKLVTSFTIDPVNELFADYSVPKTFDPYVPPPPEPEPELLLPEMGGIASESITLTSTPPTPPLP
jgi:1A family penicillin-binding protein